MSGHGDRIDVERLRRAVEGVGGIDPEQPDGWADFVVEVAKAYDADPYVGGHPEVPLHPFVDAGDGTCAACPAGMTAR